MFSEKFLKNFQEEEVQYAKEIALDLAIPILISMGRNQEVKSFLKSILTKRLMKISL